MSWVVLLAVLVSWNAPIRLEGAGGGLRPAKRSPHYPDCSSRSRLPPRYLLFGSSQVHCSRILHRGSELMSDTFSDGPILFSTVGARLDHCCAARYESQRIVVHSYSQEILVVDKWSCSLSLRGGLPSRLTDQPCGSLMTSSNSRWECLPAAGQPRELPT